MTEGEPLRPACRVRRKERYQATIATIAPALRIATHVPSSSIPSTAFTQYGSAPSTICTATWKSTNEGRKRRK